MWLTPQHILHGNCKLPSCFSSKSTIKPYCLHPDLYQKTYKHSTRSTYMNSMLDCHMWRASHNNQQITTGIQKTWIPGEGKTTVFKNTWWFMRIKETSSTFCPCISNHVLQARKEKKKQWLKTLLTLAALHKYVPVEHIYIDMTASQLMLWSCIPLPKGKPSLPAVLQHLLVWRPGPFPFTMFDMLTVWISLIPQEHPEPQAS